MKAIMYFPKTSTTKLNQKIAAIHAEAVITKINTLGLTFEKSNLLIDEICDKIKFSTNVNKMQNHLSYKA